MRYKIGRYYWLDLKNVDNILMFIEVTYKLKLNYIITLNIFLELFIYISHFLYKNYRKDQFYSIVINNSFYKIM